jgi:acetolactate decarboxylase
VRRVLGEPLGLPRVAALAALLALFATGCGSESNGAVPTAGNLFQASTIGALNIGLFEGELSIGALRAQGDFGLGTFDALDGEMIVLGGQVFRVGTDGIPRRAADSATTPFAAVTRFRPDIVFDLPGPIGLAALREALDAQLTTLNVPVAARISGFLPVVQARSVPRQSQPYPPLAVALEEQTVFNLTDVDGTLVGFRTPTYMAQLNAAGYHFHFLSHDRRAGGHILDVVAGPVRVELQLLHDFRMQLPSNAAFANADLDPGPCAAALAAEP